MEKLKMETPNLTQSNISKIEELFPNCITEKRNDDGKLEKAINFEMLKQMLSDEIVDEGNEAYEFTWVGKKESMIEANKPIRKTLRPCKEESKDWDNTENLYIEGDNLEVLKLLQESYLNKIKMIYIDPPYNTGNDFIYNDDFKMDNDEYKDETGEVDEEGIRLFKNTETNGRFHSAWCSNLYSRLMLARNLLSEDGVIFISIDDNEQENLRKICDEVFGEENFVTQIAWRRSDNQANIGNIARVKEYIIVFCKDYTKLVLGRLPLSKKAINEYRYEDENGKFRRSILLHKTRGRHYFDLKTPNGNILKGPWMKSKEVVMQMDANNEIYWPTGGQQQPYGKIYLKNSKGQISNDFWGTEFGSNQRASEEIKKLFGKRYFDFPKPVELIKTIIRLGCSEGIVLDFFAGSSSTADAVMDLNSDDGGKRKFIMVQLPEECNEKSEAYKAGYKNICEIGKERIRRAGEKIKEENKDKEGIEDLDVGFRVLKVDDTNMKDVYYSPSDIQQMDLFDLTSNIKEDRTDLDLLFGCLIDWGIPLDKPYESVDMNGSIVHIYNEGDLVACFNEEISEETIKEIAKMKPIRVVFRDSSFKTSADKINVEEIFKLLSPTTRLRVL